MRSVVSVGVMLTGLAVLAPYFTFGYGQLAQLLLTAGAGAFIYTTSPDRVLVVRRAAVWVRGDGTAEYRLPLVRP